MDPPLQPWLSTTPLPDIDGVPGYGWRVPLDYRCREKCVPFTIPRLKLLPGLLPLSYRYMKTWFKKYRQGKKMFIDNCDLVPHQPIYGAPIGGIGCGTIGRGYKGEFCRFQMIPGMYKYSEVEANQFIVCIRRNGKTVYTQVLSPKHSREPKLSSWNWAFSAENATYHALYPRSWTVYDLPGQNIRLICRQISPVFPNDYQDTSLPSAVFVWSIENQSSSDAEVSITFTFQNGQGAKEDAAGGVTSEFFRNTDVEGVMIHQSFNDMPCTYAVSSKNSPDAKTSHILKFNPDQSGIEVWNPLLQTGQLNEANFATSEETKKGEHLAVAVCSKCVVKGGQRKSLEFSLTWDMPMIHFGSRRTKYARRYTRWFGKDGKASPKLAAHSLHSYPEWEKKINEWQDPVLNNSHLPAWYKSALFNETYFVSDGGTIWVEANDDDDEPNIIREYGRFAYLEGHEYRMYNTYDVHHYASFALVMLWPKLQLSLQYDIAKAVPTKQEDCVQFCMSGESHQSKCLNFVPHDVGDPDDDPWLRLNAYLIHPTHQWKDLNTKFITQVYRDYISIGDVQFLKDFFPALKEVMDCCLKWDTDGDGIIDNGGFADQTYDAWTMFGASAYCGGLWVAAMAMYCRVAEILGEGKEYDKYKPILDKARESYETKLWNGEYYNFDCSKSKHHDSVMSDALCGQWFLKSSEFSDNSVFPHDHVRMTLQAIFKHNVLPFENGTMGAINGMRPDGSKDTSSVQSEEFWTGVVYSLGALMFQEGLMDMGWQTAYGAYRMNYEKYGLHFQTPEAYFDDNRYRSLGYMRPLSIWAMQYSLEQFHPDLLGKQNITMDVFKREKRDKAKWAYNVI